MAKVHKENSAIQTNINILQGIINRMASNSANCKTWAITIISAIIVLLIDKSKTSFFYIAYIPLVMFFLLDCFYLGLERHFKDIYNEFVNALESENFEYKNIYKIKGPNGACEKAKYTFISMWSFSTTPFYLIFGLMIFLTSKIL